MKKLTLGILAHVDAGKTTLSEGLLYLCGCIRRLGRVDHRDTFLDTAEPERSRKPRPAAAPEKKAPARKKAPAKKTAAKPAASQKQRPQTNLDEMSERRRAYGNSKPKKKSGLMLVAESVQKTAKKVGRKKSGK